MPKRRRKRTRSKALRTITILLVIVILGVGGYFATQTTPTLSLPVDLQNGEVAVHFIDVGQGDATLIQTEQGSMLIDGGNNNMRERVVQYLRDAGVTRLNYVVATHPHADHIGGLIGVLDAFEVGTIIIPNVSHTTETYQHFISAIERNGAPVHEPTVGEEFTLGEVRFTTIAPNSNGYENINNYSVSFRIMVGDTSFIITGDAEELSEHEMIAAGHTLQSDVLRLGHHGSHTSTTQEFFDAVNPTIAVISVGADNTFGHPHRAVRERIADIRVYRTDEHGHIVMLTDGVEIQVITGENTSWLQDFMQSIGLRAA